MRKTETFVVTRDGRDKGKTFIITEMPALKAEKWAARALLAIAKSGVDLPAIQNGGMAGLALAGIQALQYMDFADAEPLMDEMLTCVSIKPDPRGNPGFVRDIVRNGAEGDDIEEPATLLELRRKIFELHTGFLQPGDR